MPYNGQNSLKFGVSFSQLVSFSIAGPSVWNSLPSGIRASSASHTFHLSS